MVEGLVSVEKHIRRMERDILLMELHRRRLKWRIIQYTAKADLRRERKTHGFFSVGHIKAIGWRIKTFFTGKLKPYTVNDMMETIPVWKTDRKVAEKMINEAIQIAKVKGKFK